MLTILLPLDSTLSEISALIKKKQPEQITGRVRLGLIYLMNFDDDKKLHGNIFYTLPTVILGLTTNRVIEDDTLVHEVKIIKELRPIIESHIVINIQALDEYTGAKDINLDN